MNNRNEWVLHYAVVHSDISAAIASQTVTTRAKIKDEEDSIRAWIQKAVDPIVDCAVSNDIACKKSAEQSSRAKNKTTKRARLDISEAIKTKSKICKIS